MSSLPDPVLSVRGLSKCFGPHRVLDGVDLDVPAGRVLVLAGGNGSGKTTLLRCLAGLARHDGTVTIAGRHRPPGRDRARDVGYLPQAVGLPAWATVGEVLGLFARLRGTSEPVVALPDGFLPAITQPVRALSGGQRQRVALAVALLGQPRLLLLDEPGANLDDDGRADLITVLGRFRAAAGSVVVAAPSPGDLSGLADDTVRLVEGRVVTSPPPARHALLEVVR